MAEFRALRLLAAAIEARFVLDASPSVVPLTFPFGFKEPFKQINQTPEGRAGRIVTVPGLPGNNRRAIEFLPPRNPGRDPRPLATRGEYFHVYVWAVDRSALNDEGAQYDAASDLLDAWVRNWYLVTHTNGDTGIGPSTLIDASYSGQQIERGFGMEFVVTGQVHHMVPDELPAFVLVDSSTSVEVQGEINVINTVQP